MPNNTGLTRSQIGRGRAAPGTVGESAYMSPAQGTDGLRVHIEDPSRAHMAVSIGIEDAGGYFAADEVENALQETGGAFAGGRQNGVVTGFGYAPAGLSITFATPSTANVPTLRDFSGQSVILPNNTASVWVYIDSSTGELAQTSAASPPSITSPENVLLWQFTTSGGVVTNARDARMYVRNLDRKLPFTVRSVGPQGDQESEACFVSLDAVMTYLDHASTLNGYRTEVVIRGVVETGPLDIPLDGVHFRGEESGGITLTSGAYLFDTQGHSDITISDLVLVTDVANATVLLDTVGSSKFLTMTRCDITSGGADWQYGINLVSSTGRLTVSNVSMLVTDTGILADTPDRIVIDQTDVTAIGFVGGSIGIHMGDTPTPSESPSTVRTCTVTGFDTGIYINGTGHIVTGCTITPGTSATVGIYVDDSANVTIMGNRIDCGLNGGQVGVKATKTTAIKIANNTVYGATSYGVVFEGFVQQSSITNNLIDCNLSSAPNDPTAIAGIYMYPSGGPIDTPSYNVVSGNTVWRSRTGIYLVGTLAQPITETVVTGNLIHHCAVGTAAPSTTIGDVSVGIGAVWCPGLSVTSNNVSGIGNILTDAGALVYPTPALVSSVGIQITDCGAFTVSGNQIKTLYEKGASTATGIKYTASGVTNAVSATGVRISENRLADIPTMGVSVNVGDAAATVNCGFIGAVVSGNTVSASGAGFEFLVSHRGTVRDLVLANNVIANTTDGAGIYMSASNPTGIAGVVSGIQISDNMLSNIAGLNGVAISFVCGDDTSMDHITVTQNKIRLPGDVGIQFAVGTATVGGPGAVAFEYIDVSGNDITMSSVSGVQAIYMLCYIPECGHIRVSGNTISDTDRGFMLSATGPVAVGPTLTDTLLTEFEFTRNTIVASDIGAQVVVLGFTNGYMISDNIITASGTVCGLYSLVQVASGSANSGLVIRGNQFRALSPATNVYMGFDNSKVFDLHIEDNAFMGGGAATNAGLMVRISDSSTGAAPSIRNMCIRGNGFRDMDCPGIRIEVTGPTDPVVDTDISRNTFESVATNAAVARASAIQCELNAMVRGMSIRQNQFAAIGHSTTTHGGVDITLTSCRGLDISDNQFVATATNGYGNIISIEPTATPGVLQELSICRNQCRGVVVPSGATTPALIAVSVLGVTEVSDLSLCDNALNRDTTTNTVGIRIRSDGSVYQLQVCRNRISGSGITAPSLFFTLDGTVDDASICGNSTDGDSPGIVCTFDQPVVGLHVCDNTVIGNTVTGYGIATQASTGIRFSNSRVDRNIIRGYSEGLYVEFGDCVGLSVSGNDVSGHTVAGIMLLSNGVSATVANLSVDNNKVSNSTDAQNYGIYTTTNGGNYQNLSVCGNSVRYVVSGGADYASNMGIFVNAGGSSDKELENATICHNRVQNIEYGIKCSSGDVTNTRIDGNDITGGMAGVQHQLKGDTEGYSISNNNIQVRADSTATGIIYVFHDAAGYNFQEVNINNNTVGGGLTVLGFTYGGNGGIRVGVSSALPDARCVSVSGNQVRLSEYGVVVLFQSAHALSVNNNNISRINKGGIDVRSSYGLTSGDTDGLTIMGNSVSKWCETASGAENGLMLFLGTTGSAICRNINVSSNNCRGEDDTAVAYYLRFVDETNGFVFANNMSSFLPSATSTVALDMYTGSASALNFKNFVFTGNIFRRSDGGIIYTMLGAGNTPDECVVMGNIGDNAAATSWGQFVNGGTAGWTNVRPLVATLASLFTDLNNNNGT